MLKIVAVSCLIVLFCAWPALAQHENDLWFLGSGEFLSFQGSPHLVLDTTFRNRFPNLDNFPAPVISDPVSGELGFIWGYDWNRNLELLKGFDIVEGYAGSQWVVNFPGHDKVYLGFYHCWTGPQDMGCAVIDMNADSGRGEIVANAFPYIPTRPVTQCWIMPHANGRDYWLVYHPVGVTNTFLSYLIDDKGVSSTPVVSEGPEWLDYYRDNGSSLNGFPSPDGTRVLFVSEAMKGPTIHHFVVDFDPATGAYRSGYELHLDQYGFEGIPSVAFSPNNRFLYLSGGPPYITQIDLGSNNPDTINSKEPVIVSEVTANELDLANGPDGKIYSSLPGYVPAIIGVISAPDSLGRACNFRDSVLFSKWEGQKGFYQLTPNRFSHGNAPGIAVVKQQNCASCFSFSLERTSEADVRWSFPGGSPATAVGNAVSSVCYDAPGSYTVRAVLPRGDTLRLPLTVGTSVGQLTVPTPPNRIVAAPGTTVTVPIDYVLSGNRLDTVNDFTLECALSYDSSVLEFDANSPWSDVEAGPDFRFFTASRIGDLLVLRFSRNDSEWLPRKTHLADLRFRMKSATGSTSIALQHVSYFDGQLGRYEFCIPLESNILATIHAGSEAVSADPEFEPARSLSVRDGVLVLGAGADVQSAEILDMLGRRLETRWKHGPAGEAEISIGSLARGVYFLRTSEAGTVHLRKFLW